MENKISDILDGILSFLQNWQIPVSNLFNTGLSKEKIEESFKETGLEPTKELIELYKWRNGTQIKEGAMLDDVQIIPGFHFLSLQDGINSYLAMKDDTSWNPSWFPIFANGGGDFYGVDLSQSDGNLAPIVGFILTQKEQEVEYQNLTAMLLTFKECFERDIVFKTKEGYLEMDDDKQGEIAMKNNPKIEFWRS